MEKLCFGVDVGGTTVKIGIFSSEGKLVDKWEIETRIEESGKYILDDIVKSINQYMIKKSIKKENIIGLGLGVPGAVKEDGTVLKCANLGWGIFNVQDELSKMTGFKVKAGNDANVAALGENWQGGAKGFKSSVMVTLGTGVGGGIIIDGNILAGVNGGAGEIGHLTVVYDEKEICGCGKAGCLEQVASATGIVREASRYLAASDKHSRLRDIQNINTKEIFDAARAGDEVARELVDRMGRYLGIALSHIAGVIDPEVFVIGGGVSKAGEMLIDVIQRNYIKYAMFVHKDKQFKLAELGNDAGMYGAVKLVLE